MQKVIFDSSFLMAVSEGHSDWKGDMVQAIGNYDGILLHGVRDELHRIEAKGGKRGKIAGLSLDLCSTFTSMGSGSSSVDDEIVSAALTVPASVATNDRRLAKSLRSLRVRVISLRGGRVWVP